MKIAGRAFLVTGAASGLGAASARRLIEAGAFVALCDVERGRGAALAAELGARAAFFAADVTQEAELAQAIGAARERFGALRGAVSCAGVAPAERVLGKAGPHRLATFRAALEVNLVGTFNVLRLAAQAMAENEPVEEGERGVIVNTASIAAYEGQVGQAAYSASKAGVVGLTLPAARELARLGIRVMTIAPGVFDTPMTATMKEEARAALAAEIPFPRRLGRPEEFAALLEHVIGNPMLNGAVIRLDGALRLPAR